MRLVIISIGYLMTNSIPVSADPAFWHVPAQMMYDGWGGMFHGPFMLLFWIFVILVIVLIISRILKK